MKKVILGAVALAALIAPGIASAQQGYVGLDYGTTDIDGLGSDDAWGVSGAVELTPNFSIDGSYADNDEDGVVGATAHLYSNNDNHLLGAFLGVSDSDSSTSWGGGVEGNLYLGQATLAGAVSYTTDDDADIDVVGVNGEYRYFVSDNFRLEGGIGYFDLSGGGTDDSALNFGVGGEYQFATTPISVGLAYARTTFDEIDLDADSFTATVRYNFGGGTLHDRDHSGVGLAGLAGSVLGL